MYILIAYVLFLAYFLFLEYLISAFRNARFFSRSEPGDLPPFSLIVPFKDESERLPALLHSLGKMSEIYPDFEVIFVNDHSSDDSAELIKNADNPRFKVFNSAGEGKKRALQTGIKHSLNEHIITTDADCEIPENTFGDLLSVTKGRERYLAAGPVLTELKSSPVSRFQHAESLILSVITGGAIMRNMPLTCSGAHLGFSRSLYEAVDPYTDNIKIDSGDDHYFLRAAKRQKAGAIIWNPARDAVMTEAPASWSNMMKQKARWAGKLIVKSDRLSLVVGAFLAAANVGALLLIPAAAVFGYGFEAIVIAGLKVLTEMRMTRIAAEYYQSGFDAFSAFLSALIYPVYFIIVTIRVLAGVKRQSAP